MKKKTQIQPYAKCLRLSTFLIASCIALFLCVYCDKVVSLYLSPHVDFFAPFADRFAIIFKRYYIIPLVVFFFLSSFFIKKLYPYRYQILMLMLMLIFGQMLLLVLKSSIGRARPYMFLNQGIDGFKHFTHTRDFMSFPSGHTFNCMVVMGFIALLCSRYQPWIVAVGLSLSFMRVIALQHYLSDWFYTSYIALCYIGISYQFLARCSQFPRLHFLSRLVEH